MQLRHGQKFARATARLFDYVPDGCVADFPLRRHRCAAALAIVGLGILIVVAPSSVPGLTS